MSNVFLKEELVKYVIRKALNLSVDDIDLRSIVGSREYPFMKQVVDNISTKLVNQKESNLRCGICGRGPFTRRGLYLHLTRVHYSNILEEIDKKLKEFT